MIALWEEHLESTSLSRIKNILILFVGIAWLPFMSSCWAGDNHPNKSVSPDIIHINIEKYGAHKVVAELYSDQEKWSYINEEIGAGNAQWIKIAVELYEGSDAGASEMLVSSLGEALASAPEPVFKYAIPKIGLGLICSGPDVDNPKFNSYNAAVAAIEKRKNRLMEINDPKLKELKYDCIKHLKQSENHIKYFFTH
jgi:hypothetical protein